MLHIECKLPHFIAGVVVVCTSAILATSPVAAAEKSSNKWRIQCSGSAHAEGSIEFRVTPDRGVATTIKVAIAIGRGENAVAQDIRDAFRAQLPAGQFHVETDDGEDVLVKKASGQPNFLLELVSNGVEHVRLKPQRE